VQLRDVTEEDEKEIEASKYDLAYIDLEGRGDLLLRGAAADVEEVRRLLAVELDDVEGLVNIFGGIMKCDVIANGVIAAVKAVGLQVPLVVLLAVELDDVEGSHGEAGAVHHAADRALERDVGEVGSTRSSSPRTGT
jgi:succinyl-CoA synthetase beta subunit